MFNNRLVQFCVIILFFLPGIALAQEKVYLPIMLKQQFPSGFKDNGWLLIKPVQSTNYILNPSGEIANNFSALGGATVTRSTTYQKYGVYSYRVQTGANGDGISLTTGTLTNVIHYATVRVRGSLPNETRFLVGTGIKQPELIQKIDDHWNLYGASFTATESNGRTEFRIIQLGNGIGDFYIDGIQLEPLSYWTTYIDGSQDGCKWLGANNASASYRPPRIKSGGRIVDLLDEYGFRIDRIVGAGASPLQVNIDSYAILPGGEFNSQKVLSREFQIIGQFIADTEKDLRKNRRALRLEFQSIDNQPTQIWYTHSDVIKEIAVHYTSGLEGDLAAFYGSWETIEDNQWGYREVYTENVAIQVVAPNPYWQEVGESAAILDDGESATFQLVAARLDGEWDNLGPPNAAGTYTSVLAIVEDETYVYVAGGFSNFDNIANADNIVRWHKENRTWSAMDSGLNAAVFALALAPNGDLYVGGAFTNASGVAAADYLAVWNGTTFAAVGTPLTGAASITNVNALAFDNDGNLYIGGDFDNWNNITNADNIVMWNGSAYSALSTGANNTVEALAVDKDNLLYVGGVFSAIGGVTTDNIASWNGSAFAALGTGTDQIVYAIAIAPDNSVYVGGNFSTAGGVSANRIARWNGTAFTPLGVGLAGDQVLDISIHQNNIYVIGLFSSAGGIGLSDSIALWNGSSWSALDINLNGDGIGNAILVSQTVSSLSPDLWLGTTSTGTATYAGNTTVENEGSANAFPKISISRTGGTDATIVSIINETNNKKLLFGYSLQDGETLIVNLTPTKKSVISEPLLLPKPGAIYPNSDFGQWSLENGDNNIAAWIENTGATVVTSLLWRDQYDGYD